MDNKMTKTEFNSYYDWVKSLEERITLLENGSRGVDKIVETLGYKPQKCVFNFLELRIMKRLVDKEIKLKSEQTEVGVTKTMYNAALMNAQAKLEKLTVAEQDVTVETVRTDQSGGDGIGIG